MYNIKLKFNRIQCKINHNCLNFKQYLHISTQKVISIQYIKTNFKNFLDLKNNEAKI